MEVTVFCIRLLFNLFLLLTVRGKSSYYAQKAGEVILHIDPNQLQFFDYESISLRCAGSRGPTEWRVMKKLPSNSTQWETSTGSLDIKPAFVSHSGEYVCGNEEGERSNTINITITAGDVILESPALPVREGDDVVLSCRTRTSSSVPGDFYKDDILLKTEYLGKMTIHNISTSDEGLYKCSVSGSHGESPESRLSVTDSGEYWCETEDGQRSNTVNITVSDGSVILESPVLPAVEGDSVTLRCRSKKTSSAHIADFYKDGLLIGTGFFGEMTINPVSKSNEGLYKCSISDFGESPESWLTVRAVHRKTDVPSDQSCDIYPILRTVFTIVMVALLLLLVGQLHCGKLRVTQSTSKTHATAEIK